MDNLTKRQNDIVQCILYGATNIEISQKLNITPNTVKNHLANIYFTLGIASRTELISLYNYSIASNFFERLAKLDNDTILMVLPEIKPSSA